LNTERRKQLLEEYKNRKPEMGILSFCCTATNEKFLCQSKDTKAHINSNVFQLSAKTHPNKRLQALWNQYSESGFDISVIQVLKYEDPPADYAEKLEKLLAKCLDEDPSAKLVWKRT